MIMQKLCFGLFAAFIVAGAFAVACGNDANNKIKFIDSSVDSSGDVCNVLTNTGCANPGDKCTWIADQAKPTRLGHIGCAPAGDKQEGDACTRNAPGPMGWDDCAKGLFCRGDADSAGGGPGVCHTVCDPTDTTTCPTTHACVQYQVIFQSGSNYEAGMCDHKCNPLTDNDFLGSNGSAGQPGSQCKPTEGCYGAPARQLPVTEFTCARIHNTDLHHRDICNSMTGNSGEGCGPRNTCAPGYVPLLYADNIGSMVVLCIGMCEPATCLMGNCGTAGANKIGKTNVPSYRCQPQDLLGTVVPSTGSSPGLDADHEHCEFNWRYEIGSDGTIYHSNWSDTMGWCEDHGAYRYDSNADGMFNDQDDIYPACDVFTTPGFGTGSAVGTGPGACSPANGCVAAANFGCVDETTAGFPPMFKGERPRVPNNPFVKLPRAPYNVAQ
jgi:hypothetical protein